MTRPEILDSAKKMVTGQRQQDYGTPENNFRCIAALWSAYKGVDFTPLDVAMMMTLLKMGRIITGTGTDDSFIDAAGYIACGGEIVAETKKADGPVSGTTNITAPTFPGLGDRPIPYPVNGTGITTASNLSWDASTIRAHFSNWKELNRLWWIFAHDGDTAVPDDLLDSADGVCMCASDRCSEDECPFSTDFEDGTCSDFVCRYPDKALDLLRKMEDKENG